MAERLSTTSLHELDGLSIRIDISGQFQGGMTMAITVTPLRFHELSPQDLSIWDALQRSEPTLVSPYFRPEYVAAVAAVRPQTEVAVIRNDDVSIGFFPYERQPFNIAAPVGLKMTDYHGIIARHDATFSLTDLLRGCRLNGYHFNHLAPGQSWFAAAVRVEHDSPCVDIRGGLDGFLSRRSSGRIDGWLRKRRKLAREIGPLRVELQCQDENVFNKLLDWKSTQYQRTGVPDVFSYGWTRELLRCCWKQRGAAFSGCLSTLYAGDKVVAVDFGLRSGGVLHGWFPAYDVDMSQYGPGVTLNLEIMDAAAAEGVECIDLGRGSADYKQTLMTSAHRVGEGAISLGWAAHLLHDTWPRMRERLRNSSLKRPAAWIGRATRAWRGYLAFR